MSADTAPRTDAPQDRPESVLAALERIDAEAPREEAPAGDPQPAPDGRDSVPAAEGEAQPDATEGDEEPAPEDYEARYKRLEASYKGNLKQAEERAAQKAREEAAAEVERLRADLAQREARGKEAQRDSIRQQLEAEMRGRDDLSDAEKQRAREYYENQFREEDRQAEVERLKQENTRYKGEMTAAQLVAEARQFGEDLRTDGVKAFAEALAMPEELVREVITDAEVYAAQQAYTQARYYGNETIRDRHVQGLVQRLRERKAIEDRYASRQQSARRNAAEEDGTHRRESGSGVAAARAVDFNALKGSGDVLGYIEALEETGEGYRN